MSPGNRAMDMLAQSYIDYNDAEKAKDDSVNLALVDDYPELISNGYRSSAIIVQPMFVTYEHPKMVGNNKVISTCSLPGWIACWWNNIKHGDVWECCDCKGKWKLMDRPYCWDDNSFYTKWKKVFSK